MITQSKSLRKPTGGRYKNFRKKKLFESGRIPSHTKIDEKKLKKLRIRGGSQKQRLLSINTANVLDKKTNKYSKAKIISIIDNPANKQFVRRNIITKGAVINTDKGNAKVTSRPGQDGAVNAVLI
ncbi:30S ribosomal protein S8e [Candidatus Woesearchaeota archaeon]|nr:30S ribosomal protein S8e [Candidatus Woesearchaeota archaeon]|tara:strand:+ start:8455 stop:8829 length:375 start_codon:yes stop_codon:yes gene_type:complete